MNYKMNSVNLSEKMVEVIKRKMNGENVAQEDSGLNKREWEDLKDKMSFSD
jgi:hypothetical protein